MLYTQLNSATVSVFNRVYPMVFNSLVVALTWQRTVQDWRLLLKLDIETSLSGMIFRDGVSFISCKYLRSSLDTLHVGTIFFVYVRCHNVSP